MLYVAPIPVSVQLLFLLYPSVALYPALGRGREREAERGWEGVGRWKGKRERADEEGRPNPVSTKRKQPSRPRA
jgi:hypothetical protein